jgi:hypothetical protein
LRQARIDGATGREMAERFGRTAGACIAEVNRMRETDPTIPLLKPAGRVRT